MLKIKEAQRKTFHLGEMIEIEEDYASAVPGQYSLLVNPEKVEGGAFPTLWIVPGEGVIDRLHDTGRVSAAAILTSYCAGGGLLGGAGGACGDCDGVFQLGREPIRFPYVLNYRFAITKPGHYTIQARASNVVAAWDPDKPIAIVATPVEIEIVDDDAWSQEQLRAAVHRYEEARQRYTENGWDKVDARAIATPDESETGQQMENAAETIRFLNTEQSLRESVRLYNGSPRVARYENTFLKAILESSHRDVAVQLLAKRMVDEDFLVSDEFLDLLTAMSIQVEEPIAFARGDRASRQQLNSRTLEILRGYVLALGESLPSKFEEAQALGITTFEKYAAADYCTGEPLIAKRQADEILASVRRK